MLFKTLVVLHFNQSKSQNPYKVYTYGSLLKLSLPLSSSFSPLKAHMASWLFFLHNRHILISQNLCYGLLLFVNYPSFSSLLRVHHISCNFFLTSHSWMKSTPISLFLLLLPLSICGIFICLLTPEALNG